MNPLKVRIYYEDTDAGGVVYYANYLKFMERARTEFFRDYGIDVVKYHEEGNFFVVVHVDINYRHPARLGDIVTITTEIVEITNVTILLRHLVLRENTILVEARIKIAYINKKGRPQRLPQELRRIEVNANK